MALLAAAQSSFTAPSSPMIIRACPRAVASANAPQRSPDGTTFAPTWQSAARRSPSPSAGLAMSSRNTRSIGSSAQKARIWSSVGLTNLSAAIRRGYRVRAMPIHVRAEPGDYAEAVLLPGDPLRAKYIADTYLDEVVQTNSERGMLGFRGTWEGTPVSVQSTGMGCPSAAIVVEELVMLGCKKLLRVGTCGGLQPHHALGDMIVALSAVPQDGTVKTYVKEPHCPTADWGLVHEAVHQAKELGQPIHVGPIVSSDVFYNPDGEQYQRWSDRGILAVEMESSILFTLGALRKVHAGCLLTVSDIVVEGEFKRITDDELRAAVDRMTRVALATVTSDH